MTTDQNSKSGKTDYQNLVQIAGARARLFGLLAVAFFDPTADLVEQIINGDLFLELKANFKALENRSNLPQFSQESFSLFAKHQDAFSKQDASELLHELKIEFARLFIGPGRAAVPPFETFYKKMSKESQPLLMVSPEAIAVQAAYREAGIAVSQDLQEPPDHFATECEFVYFLCNQEANGWEMGDVETAKQWRRHQLEFLSAHLGRWGAQFCADVEAESSHVFYQAIGQFGHFLMQIEGRDIPQSSN